MVLVCNALKQCDCRIYTNFFSSILNTELLYTRCALQTGVRVLLHVQAQLQQRHEAVDEGAPWKAHAPRTRSRLLLLWPRPRPHHSRRRRCVYKYFFRLLGGLTQQHTHQRRRLWWGRGRGRSSSSSHSYKAVKGQTNSSTLTSPIDKIAGTILL